MQPSKWNVTSAKHSSLIISTILQVTNPLPQIYIAFGNFCDSIILLAYSQNINSREYGVSLRSLCLVRINPFFSTKD